jgi:hypothetical protein
MPKRSRCSPVSIVTRLRVGRPGFSLPSGPDWHWGPLSLLCNRYRGLLPGGKAAGAWSYTSTPQYVFMEWFLVKNRNNFTCTCMPKQEVVKLYRGPGIEVPCILNFGIRVKWTTSFRLRPFYSLLKNALDKELCRSQKPSGGGEVKIPTPSRNRTPVVQPAAS